jgi:hypothetical protein
MAAKATKNPTAVARAAHEAQVRMSVLLAEGTLSGTEPATHRAVRRLQSSMTNERIMNKLQQLYNTPDTGVCRADGG